MSPFDALNQSVASANLHLQSPDRQYNIKQIVQDKYTQCKVMYSITFALLKETICVNNPMKGLLFCEGCLLLYLLYWF